MATPATRTPAIMPKNIASKNGIDRRNRRRIHLLLARRLSDVIRQGAARSSPGSMAITSRQFDEFR
jgi:hypothetical protein